MALENAGLPDAVVGVSHPAPSDDGDSILDTIQASIEQQRSRAGGAQDADVDVEAPADADPRPAEGDAPSRQRDANGRFVSKEPGQEKSAIEAEKPQTEADEKREPAAQPGQDLRPPPGFSPRTKAIWEQLPDHVRADIAKRENEFDAGMRRYAGLGKYAEVAERNGRTLGQAVASYAEVESALYQDFPAGIELICKQMKVEPERLAAAFVHKYFGVDPGQFVELLQGQQPQGPQGQGNQNAPQNRALQFDPNQIASQVYAQVQNQMLERDIMNELTRFERDPAHRFYSNVRPVMAALVGSGQADTLEQAYEAACWMNPEIRSILLAEQQAGSRRETAAVDRARAAAKAVGGAPAAGVNAPANDGLEDLSIMETIKRAVASQRDR